MYIVDSSRRVSDIRSNNKLKKYFKYTYTFDVDEICFYKAHLLSKSGNEYYELSVNYLNYLLNQIKARRNKFEVKWSYDNTSGEIISEPLKFFRGKFATTDFVQLSGQKIVYVQYKKMCNIIAFYLSYKDLGYSFKDIENILKDKGLTTLNDTHWLSQINFEFEDIFSKEVINSDVMGEDNSIYDYFGRKTVRDMREQYKKIIKSSFGYALYIILNDIFSELNGTVNPEDVRVFEIGLSEIGVVILDVNVMDKVVEALSKPVKIKAFNRWFFINPEITII